MMPRYAASILDRFLARNLNTEHLNLNTPRSGSASMASSIDAIRAPALSLRRPSMDRRGLTALSVKHRGLPRSNAKRFVALKRYAGTQSRVSPPLNTNHFANIAAAASGMTVFTVRDQSMSCVPFVFLVPFALLAPRTTISSLVSNLPSGPADFPVETPSSSIRRISFPQTSKCFTSEDTTFNSSIDFGIVPYVSRYISQ